MLAFLTAFKILTVYGNNFPCWKTYPYKMNGHYNKWWIIKNKTKQKYTGRDWIVLQHWTNFYVTWFRYNGCTVVGIGSNTSYHTVHNVRCCAGVVKVKSCCSIFNSAMWQSLGQVNERKRSNTHIKIFVFVIPLWIRIISMLRITTGLTVCYSFSICVDGHYPEFASHCALQILVFSSDPNNNRFSRARVAFIA